MLYEPGRHESPLDSQWNDRRARAAIDDIVGDTESTFDPEALWPIHPFDRSPERPPDSIKALYHGAAGVIWALHHLRENDAANLQRDYLPTLRTLAQRFREDLEKHAAVRRYMGRELGSYFLGEAGVHLVQYKIEPSVALADELYIAAEKQIGDVPGLAWGSAGAMILALSLYRRSNESRWAELYVRHFEALWNRWEYCEEARCWLWQHDLYGDLDWRIGALHGFIANVLPMLRGRALLPVDRMEAAYARILDTVRATVLLEGASAN